MPVSTDQTENKNGLASDNASPLKVKTLKNMFSDKLPMADKELLGDVQQTGIFTRLASNDNAGLHVHDVSGDEDPCHGHVVEGQFGGIAGVAGHDDEVV